MTNHAFYKQCLAICARGFENFNAAESWFKVRKARIYSLPVERAAEIMFAFRQAQPKCFGGHAPRGGKHA